MNRYIKIKRNVCAALLRKERDENAINQVHDFKWIVKIRSKK